MVVEKMVEHGMQREDCMFVLEDLLGFEPDFGKCEYAWDADGPKMRWMLPVADKFVSLMMGSVRSERPSCLVWDSGDLGDSECFIFRPLLGGV